MYPDSQKNQQQLERSGNDNLEISASVSFTGSCDPQDMRVLSSSFCSISERIIVESNPIIVPIDMLVHSLTATWGDNKHSSATLPPFDSSTTTTTRNASCAVAGADHVSSRMMLPHLYLSIQDDTAMIMKSESTKTISSDEKAFDEQEDNHECFLTKPKNHNVNTFDFKKTPEKQTEEDKEDNEPKTKTHGAATIQAKTRNKNEQHLSSEEEDKEDGSQSSFSLCKSISCSSSSSNSECSEEDTECEDSSIFQDSNVSSCGDAEITCTIPERMNFQSPKREFNLRHDEEAGPKKRLPLENYSESTKDGPPTIQRVFSRSLSYEEDDLFANARDAIFNTPTSDDDTAVPHILEFNVSVNIQQHVPNPENNDEKCFNFQRNSFNLQSSCGEAIAHLILFPDIIENPSSPVSSTKISNGRIIELPLRRKTIPFYRSGASSVSDRTGSYLSTVSGTSLQTRKHKVMRTIPQDENDPADVWVDLDEDAIITVQLQECTKEDEAAFESGKRVVFDTNNVTMSSDIPALTTDQNLTSYISTKIVLYSDNRNVEVTLDSSCKRNLFRISDENSEEDEDELKLSVVRENSNDAVKETNPASTVFHDIFQIENVMNFCAGVKKRCNEETDLHSHDANISMDSTIQSLYY